MVFGFEDFRQEAEGGKQHTYCLLTTAETLTSNVTAIQIKHEGTSQLVEDTLRGEGVSQRPG